MRLFVVYGGWIMYIRDLLFFCYFYLTGSKEKKSRKREAMPSYPVVTSPHYNKSLMYWIQVLQTRTGSSHLVPHRKEGMPTMPTSQPPPGIPSPRRGYCLWARCTNHCLPACLPPGTGSQIQDRLRQVICSGIPGQAHHIHTHGVLLPQGGLWFPHHPLPPTTTMGQDVSWPCLSSCLKPGLS